MWMTVRYGLVRICSPIISRSWLLTRLWYRAWGLRLDGHPDDDVWYFAYGANMHDSAFRERRKMRPAEWRAGRIKGYRLRFNLEGRPKGKAAPANLSLDEDAEVWGVQYRISRRELIRLGATEGVPGRRYRPVWTDAEDVAGNTVNVVTFIANGKEKDGKPSLRYINLLREGARSHNLPNHWVAFLESIKHAE